MSDERWYFTKEQLENSASRRCGIDADKELNYRQLAANLIQDMGSRKHLSVNQLCISTAIVYMHRFYVFHSFTHFHWNAIAMASLFLAAKVEEQTRKLEHVIKVGQWCLQKSQSSIDCSSESYLDQVQELVMNENILLQTLGFDVAIKHPHAFIVEFSEKVKMNKDITKTMYGMASNSLHVTTMCVQYKPSVVACFCIHFVCTWSNHEIQLSGENRAWWSFIDSSVTLELLKQMTEEFLAALDKSPLRMQNKLQELLRNRHVSNHHALNGDRKPEISDQSSSGSFGHSAASTSSASSLSTSMSHLQKRQHVSTNNHSISGSNRVHKSSSVHSSNHHHSSHSTLHSSSGYSSSSSSASLMNGNTNAIPNAPPASSSLVKSNSAAHVSSSQSQQHRQQPRHPQHQQHHRHHGAQMSTSSQHAHKTASYGNANNVSHPNVNPAAISHSTGTDGSGCVVPAKEIPRPDRSKITEIRLKPRPVVKQEPAHHAPPSAAAVSSISTHRRAVNDDFSAKHTHQKVVDGHSREFNQFATNSRSDTISNVVKEVAMANQSEKRADIKTEPPENNIGSLANRVVAPVTSKSHSIFSPSPPPNHDRFKLPPAIAERIVPIEVEIKREPLPENVQVKQEPLFSETQIKPEPSTTTPSIYTNHSHVSRRELIPGIKNDKTTSYYGKILEKNTVTAPSSVSTDIKSLLVTNPISLAPSLNHVEVKVEKEPCEIKTEPCKYSAFSSSSSNSQPPLVSNFKEELAIRNDQVDSAVMNACSPSTSHTHKKKKKHKEKDKRHKEKKRHKEDKHHHRKEHSSKEKERREPGPIKITIPKEKLADIAVKLKIKINKDLIVPLSTSEASTSYGVEVKNSPENVSKSRKRKRESDHDHSSRKHARNLDTNSQNGFK